MANYPQPGTVLLGKYLVDSLIGEGGMGAVIKAKHIGLDESVAIKCLLPEMLSRADIVARFLREAKAAVKLKGEHVARVLDVGRLENQVPYIVMEYLDGADLNAIIKHYGAQDPSVATDLLLQACEAIAEAHSLNIIHRDVKASNFFVTQPPNHPPVLKVLDFGIATAPEGASDLTSTQSVIGTPAYMAPEQMRSSRTADARSDIWSMGVVLYELLEGRRPFLSEVYSELCLKVGMDPPEPMRAPGVPDGLRAVVMKCLEKPIERRYQSVAELAFDLLPFATDPVAARALVEQCARLLGRKSARPYDHKTPRPQLGDLTPAPYTPPPYPPPPGGTPPAGVEVDSEATEMTPVSQSMVLGRPTPMPGGEPKTPTSIGAGAGELSSIKPVPAAARRRGGMIAILALAVVVIAGGAVIALGHTGGDDGEQGGALATQPAPDPAAPAVTPAVPAPAPAAPVPDPNPTPVVPAPPPTPDPKATLPDPTPVAPPVPAPVKPTKPAQEKTPKQHLKTTPKTTPKTDPGDIYTKRQ